MTESFKFAFARESFEDVYPEAEPLTQLHYAELAAFKQIPLAPQLSLYAKIEEQGALRLFTVRNHGKLIGYNGFFLTESLHYGGTKQVAQDVLFLHPDYRGLGLGKDFMLWCDIQLKKESVVMSLQTVNVKHDHSEMLRAMGYQLCEQIYGRML